MLQFDYPAKECAREYTNLIEMNLQPHACLADVRDAASKIADNMARLAGLFHLCNDPKSSEIPYPTVKQACTVSDWYLGGFKHVFGEESVVPIWQQDAELLRTFLFEMAMRQKCGSSARTISVSMLRIACGTSASRQHSKSWRTGVWSASTTSGKFAGFRLFRATRLHPWCRWSPKRSLLRQTYLRLESKLGLIY